MTDLVDLRTAVRRSGAYLVIDGTWLQSRDALRGTGFDALLGLDWQPDRRTLPASRSIGGIPLGDGDGEDIPMDGAYLAASETVRLYKQRCSRGFGYLQAEDDPKFSQGWFDSVGRTARVIGDVLSYDWR